MYIFDLFRYENDWFIQLSNLRSVYRHKCYKPEVSYQIATILLHLCHLYKIWIVKSTCMYNIIDDLKKMFKKLDELSTSYLVFAYTCKYTFSVSQTYMLYFQ